MKANNFKTALDQGKIKEGDYFKVKYPNGMVVLFRLFKTEKDYMMWGPPTAEKVSFIGKEGYDNIFTLADSQARKEYANDIFEDVHACSLPKKEYKIKNFRTLLNEMRKFDAMYDFSDASVPSYALASRCVCSESNCAGFYLFYMYGGTMFTEGLYYSSGGPYGDSYAVRPEGIPKPTMQFLEEGCDGSEERPWICLGSQEEEKIPKQSEEGTSRDEDIININKDRLMCLIREGHKLQESANEWLAELEECAQNLK